MSNDPNTGFLLALIWLLVGVSATFVFLWAVNLAIMAAEWSLGVLERTIVFPVWCWFNTRGKK